MILLFPSSLFLLPCSSPHVQPLKNPPSPCSSYSNHICSTTLQPPQHHRHDHYTPQSTPKPTGERFHTPTT
ncbi:hypothetical protein AAZX31_14G116500 [Glycine max]|nr:hypothetical protein GLYMA_14G128350v4 [Glycine max]KAH1094254.1 hypothetical protein GYH30_039802 [Glycine max]